MNYSDFIYTKHDYGANRGFEPIWMPDFLFDFQASLVGWAIEKGRSALFEDCGLGKTPQQLVWAENVCRHTNKPVLILTPLAVSHQTVREAHKFGIEAERSHDGKFRKGARIIVTNYERLHHFNADDFGGCACDESSILKNFDGQTKEAVTEFMRKVAYRLLCTATAAPNDYIELGTSSEALGEMGYMDMLQRFFKANDGSMAHGGSGNGARRFSKNPFGGKFRFRGHAEHDFWRWVCSWARAVRKPSDLGFDDGNFTLPELTTRQYVVRAEKKKDDFLFDLPAISLEEQRDERRRTIKQRCEKVAEIVNHTGKPFVSWCALNDEGDMLEEMIPDAVQVSGSDSDEKKEESFRAFEDGEVRGIVTKSVIAGFGLNWQHCAHMTFFPSHSFEQYYQSVRRCWRFGQKSPVTVDVITSECEERVLSNLQRKAAAADEMFARLVAVMNNELKITQTNQFTKKEKAPLWL
ncbi:MAG: Flavobacterium phage vB FspS snusmum6 [Verrucomicrobiota bacterium]|jgi:hypothetical protein